MRLTDKGRCSLNIDEDISGEYCPNSSLSDCIDKLGQLEDIEQELGIDLTTLIKAQMNGFYIKNCLGIDKVNLSDFKFNLAKKEVHRIAASEHFYFKDYGKTWALTREELEK